MRIKTVSFKPKMRTATIPAAVNTASRITARQTPRLNLHSNTDRLAHTTVPANTPRGTVIYDQIITPAIASRLRQQAALYQMINYTNLRFEIQTQTATSNAGGYIAAFLHDPMMDVGSGESALRALTAVQGTQTSKFWQSISMSARANKHEYYTLSGSDVRLFSPGRFVVLSDGSPTTDVEITILFHWTVSLRKPALQRLVAQLPQAVLTASYLYSDEENVRYANWNPADNTFTPPINGEGSEFMENAFSGLPPASSIGTSVVLWYQLPYSLAIAQTDVSIRNANFASFRVIGGATPHYAMRFHSLPTDADTYTIWSADGNDKLMVQGLRLNPITVDEFSGNAESSFLVNVSPSVSVNQQPMICKQLQTVKPTQSGISCTMKETIQDKLSQLHQTLSETQ